MRSNPTGLLLPMIAQWVPELIVTISPGPRACSASHRMSKSACSRGRGSGCLRTSFTVYSVNFTFSPRSCALRDMWLSFAAASASSENRYPRQASRLPLRMKFPHLGHANSVVSPRFVLGCERLELHTGHFPFMGDLALTYNKVINRFSLICQILQRKSRNI